MGLVALGINHKTASVDTREKVAFLPETLPQSLQEACAATGMPELAILSTCNRTEFYGFIDNPEQLVRWLQDVRKLAPHELGGSLYEFKDAAAVRHLMRVASGLDSMILGEPQIFGQVKTAYQHAQQAGTVGQGLDRVFQQVFAAVKRVRTETAIGANPVSVGFAAVQLARQIFADLGKTTALLVGAGEMIELVGKHLKEQGVAKIIIANRTLARAENLAAELGNARAVLLADLHEVLPQADIVISCTGSALPIIGKGMVESALRKRRRQPMFMVDIAVPRDIEPEVDRLNDVYLYTVDDLEEVIAENRRARQDAATEAENLIIACTARYEADQRVQAATGLVTAYRTQVEALRQEEVAKAAQMLAKGMSAEEVLERVTRNLANKLMHAPTISLKEAAAERDTDKLAWATKLLGIKDQNSGENE
ncbi:glutamyl-tRNA reductase [Fluviicoccus keumensis]|uniref:Glutamyl-tRNA reductase n=1 Tax=Fluviicoccus keumensis TaxID=1435465 RepID=A0A4Q7ZAS0_9GAMM|nr:glutamyl-tRNA reductase [Fluviicoccus keumensis]RZU47191.1 glutamyl-tRNA reductase [Fluviicoccus keumensis]